MISLNPAKLNRCDWFLIVWFLYYLQGLCYEKGSTTSYILLGVNLFISAICAIKILRWNDNPVFFKGLNLLMIMFTVYGVHYMLVNPSSVTYAISGMKVSSYNYIKSIYLSLLPIYAFYYFSRTGYLTKDRLQRWGFVFIVSVTLCYYQAQQEMKQAIMEDGDVMREEFTNNMGYMFLSCIPLLNLYRRKLLQFSFLFFIMVFIILSMKRGALIIGTIAGVFFMYQIVRNSNKRRVVIIFGSVVLCAMTYYLFVYRMSISDYMLLRVQSTLEGNSSGRDNLYSFFWTYFTERTDNLHYLFGRGANGTLEIYYSYAHDDWLEIAINQGLLGVIVYAIYWVCFYRTWKYISNIEAKVIIAIIIVVYFLKTLFSMSYNDMTYVVTSVLGYALATVNNPNYINK